ncbi:MAG: alpha-D-ribose 1-methylphosphonate 5-triphosphate diphosphatase [Rhodospirillales bacterium]|nr:alpha-D-ribose 1-methylphosphonate 5-triphosphate diphosphatase [Rhodospirillales bacterium]
MSDLTLIGGAVLVPGAGLRRAALQLSDGQIAAIDAAGPGRRFNATGLWVLPGLIDLHGDAFERQLQPRPGVDFPAALAIEETEAQLLANGITTAYLGVTLSWEPGLRGIETWHALLAALAAHRGQCDLRVHLRWEAYNLEALETAEAAIAAGQVHLLAFNDHTPGILARLDDPAAAAKFIERAGVCPEAFRAVAARAAARAAACAAEIPAAQARLAAAARSAGIPLASHDDASLADRERFRALGARICEFPMAEEVGQAARAAGDAVVMGSPNVLRGRSHLGWASAARLAEAGICSILTSDYYYPALARAALVLAGRGVLDLEQAWGLVSAAPAAAAGLADRGTIAPGQRADLVVLAPADARGPARLVATIAGGRIAWAGGEGHARLT